jgi:hypothetical protein
MDETRKEKTPTSTHTTINRTQTKPSSGGGVMWFLMGGIVVVVAIVAYLVMGEGGLKTSGATEPAGGNVSINVDTNDAPAAPAVEEAPSTDIAPSPTETTPPAD